MRLCSLYITISSDNPIISHNRIYCNRKADIRDMYAKNAATLNECGIDACMLILRSICSFDDAMNTENAAENHSGTTEQVFRVVGILN